MERNIVEGLRLGDSIKKISRELGVGRNSIRRVRDQATTAGYLDGTQKMPAYPEAIFSEVPDGCSIRGSPRWKELEGHIQWIKERPAAGMLSRCMRSSTLCRRPNYHHFHTRDCTL